MPRPSKRDTEREPTMFPDEGEGGHEEFLVAFIRALNLHYLKTDRRTGTVLAILPGQIVKWPFNMAFPKAMEPLLVELERLTREIPIDPPGAILGNDVPQWRRDREAWKERLRHYRSVQLSAVRESPDGPPLEIPIQFSEMDQHYIDEVALPLLLGWFPGADVQKPLDAVTPISLAYQAQILDVAYKRNVRLFVTEIKERAVAAAKITFAGGSLILMAIGVYGAIEFIKGFRKSGGA